MSYDCVTATTYSTSHITFTIPWEHELSELKILCFVLDEDNYEYTIVDSGTLTTPYSDESIYRLECPFTFSSTASTTKWAVYVYRHTTTTVDDPSYDGSTIPIEALISKLEEHGEKLEEAVVESLRAVRVPESDSNAFYPPAEVRAGKVAGFDDDGNPTVGSENIAELADYTAELDDRVEQAKDYAEQAAASAEEAADSASDAARDAATASTAATSAQAYYELAVDELRSDLITAGAYADSAAASATTAASSASSAAESANEALSYEELAKVYLQAIYGNLQIVVYSSYDDLPSPGSPTEFYFVGNDDDGYTEYLWVDDDGYEAGGYYLKVGSSDFSALQPATTTQYGLVRLSTDEVLEDDDCAAVGVNSAGQLLIPAANRSATSSGGTATNVRGTVKLGSTFHPVNGGTSFCVGIGTAESDGGLAFDLYKGEETKTDAEGNEYTVYTGALAYESLGTFDSTGNETYALRIYDATSGQRGAVKLVSSLDTLSEDDINEQYPIGEPYAAHVQIVVQSVKIWAENYFTDTKIQEFFEKWAAEAGTLEEMVGIITADENYLASFTNAFAANTTFMNSVYAQVSSASVDWWVQIFSSDDPENDDDLSEAQQSAYGTIMAKISAEANNYFEVETYRSYVDAMLSAYFNGDTESEYYPSAATDTFVVLVGDGVSDYFEDEANLATFIAKTLATNTSYAYDGSTTLTGTVESVIMQVAKKLVQEYWDDLMAGNEKLTINGEEQTLSEYLEEVSDSATEAAKKVSRWYFSSSITATELSFTSALSDTSDHLYYVKNASFGSYDAYVFSMRARNQGRGGRSRLGYYSTEATTSDDYDWITLVGTGNYIDSGSNDTDASARLDFIVPYSDIKAGFDLRDYYFLHKWFRVDEKHGDYCRGDVSFSFIKDDNWIVIKIKGSPLVQEVRGITYGS